MESIEKERLLKFAHHISQFTRENQLYETLSLTSLDGTNTIRWQMKIPGWLFNEMVACFDEWIIMGLDEPKWIESEPEENAFTSLLDFFGINEIESFETIFSYEYTGAQIANNIHGYIERFN